MIMFFMFFMGPFMQQMWAIDEFRIAVKMALLFAENVSM